MGRKTRWVCSQPALENSSVKVNTSGSLSSLKADIAVLHDNDSIIQSLLSNSIILTLTWKSKVDVFENRCIVFYIIL
jgi:hypothetical protein